MKNDSKLIRGAVCTLIGGTLWGFSGCCTQYLVADCGMSVTFITWFRMVVAGAILVAVLAVKNRAKLIAMVKDRATRRQMAVFALFGVLLGQLAYAASILYTDAGTATVLQSTGVVILIAWVCLTQRSAPKGVEVIGAVLALASTFLLATQGDLTSMHLSAAGLTWGMINGVSCAVFAGYPKRMLQKWGAFPVMGCAMLLGSFMVLPFAQPWSASAVTSTGAAMPWSLLSVAALLCVAVLGTVVAFTLYLQGIADLGGVKASLLSIIEPVSAAVFAWALMGTEFSSADLLGFALMMAMVVIVTVPMPASKRSREATLASDADVDLRMDDAFGSESVRNAA